MRIDAETSEHAVASHGRKTNGPASLRPAASLAAPSPEEQLTPGGARGAASCIFLLGTVSTAPHSTRVSFREAHRFKATARLCACWPPVRLEEGRGFFEAVQALASSLMPGGASFPNPQRIYPPSEPLEAGVLLHSVFGASGSPCGSLLSPHLAEFWSLALIILLHNQSGNVSVCSFFLLIILFMYLKELQKGRGNRDLPSGSLPNGCNGQG